LSEWQELAQKIQTLFSQGQFPKALEDLLKINTAEVPRADRLPLARIARKLGRPDVGFRLLGPVIRPEVKTVKASAQELVEYAGLLQNIGSLDEALSYLKDLPLEMVPEAALYQAYCHLNRWESQKAVDCLRVFLELDGVAPEMRLNAKVNLASATMGVPDYPAAAELVTECTAEATKAGQIRLAAHCNLIHANIYLAQGDVQKARPFVERAAPILSQGTAHEREILAQRYACLDAFDTKQIEPLVEYRKKAIQNSNWLAARETDFEILMTEFDERRFSYLYFGTPFEGYRRRLVRQFGMEPAAQTYLYGAAGSRSLDMSTGILSDGKTLSAGKKTHQLLTCLLGDFYAPIRLGALYSKLFPGEHFDINSSPGRIHQLLFRARRDFKDAGIPVVIQERNGFYFLEMREPFSFHVHLGREAKNTNELCLQTLAERFAGEEFDASQAREVLKRSPSGFKKLMRWALETGRVERIGSNRQTRYRLCRTDKKAS
jgi:tetratricopeptide (TPR) repeat protein